MIDMRDRCGTELNVNDIVVNQGFNSSYKLYHLTEIFLKNLDPYFDDFKFGDLISNSDREPNFIPFYHKEMKDCVGRPTGIFDINKEQIYLGDIVQFHHYGFGDWNFETLEVEKEKDHVATVIERRCVRHYSNYDKKFNYNFQDDSGRYWSLGHLKYEKNGRPADFIKRKTEGAR